MSADSTKKTLIVALGVCLVCSILVSTAAVALSSKQKENKQLDMLKNILQAGNLYEEATDIKKTFDEKIAPKLVELKSGSILNESEYNDVLNPTTFDIKVASGDQTYGTDIDAAKDIAKIKRRPTHMVVYEVMNNDEVEKYIMPIYGKGLWSTLYGFIALDKDLKTIKGITFYEHGETPGLGGEVDNPKWKQIWNGKKAFDDQWNVKISVIKGKVDPSSESSVNYEVDGLSGSTLTTRGVDQLVKYWLGDDGYGLFFEKLREVGTHEEI